MQRSALATTRSLGAKGLYIITADDTLKNLSGASRFSKQSLVYPSPQFQTDAFITYLQYLIIQHKIDMIFPMSEITCSVIMKNRDVFQNVVVPLAQFDKFDFLSNKSSLFKLADSLNLPIPDTFFIEKQEGIESIVDQLKFPVVLKPARSRISTKNGWLNTTVAFARSIDELNEIINQHIYFSEYPFMIQSFIQGIGQGLFALYKEGQPICFFSHKRLKEKPPQGGVSVLSESVEATPAMRHSATTLLNHVKWSGVAMVEFKVAPDGTPYLMEINARFWGSLQLAIDSDVNFPYLLYQTYSDESFIPPTNYKKGVKLRWLLGDLDRLFIVFKDTEFSIGYKFKAFISFLNFFRPGMRYEINRFNDMKPFIFELKQYIKVNILRL
jgi:predicted ATP-grasp superfamily ATP-dependent carboligase